MRKKRGRLGFTMAELLVVVAIIGILGGVAALALTSQQRSLAQLERNAIAKEIYVAAQNHLSMAESQGYLSEAVNYGKPDTSVTDAKNVYYIVSGNADTQAIQNMLLPFGSIDETVRTGGSYIIHYQSNPAQVLDVFYCTPSGKPDRFNRTLAVGDLDSIDALMTEHDNKTGVVGWYGGVDPLANASYGNYMLEPPSVEIENKDRLVAYVKDPNRGNVVPADDVAGACLKLIITGQSSQAQASINLIDLATTKNGHPRFHYDPVNSRFEVVLDDITTAGLHFADLNSPGDDSTIELKKDSADALSLPTPFIPGENISVQAVAYNNTELSNIAYSGALITNSLFADLDDTGETAMIEYVRHLENLDARISSLDKNDSDDKLNIAGARQIADLDWSDFLTQIKAGNLVSDVTLYGADNAALTTAANSYLPVTPSTATADGDPTPIALAYEGNQHKVSDITVDAGAAAGGMFGSLASGSSVKNLELVDFTVGLTSGNAGALVGTLVQTSALEDDEFNVSNVLVRNTPEFETELAKSDDTKTSIKTDSGSAGGLIGAMTGGHGKVEKSAAAVIVKGTASAGGLIGTSPDGGTVSYCYSGGHTIDRKLGSEVVGLEYDKTDYNVTASAGAAGGLIGVAGSTQIDHSYSTCSVKGATAGGLVGTAGGDISHSYSTGLVSGTSAQGAFAGDYATGTATECLYFEIINEITDDTTGSYTCMTAVPKTGDGDGTKAGVSALDANADSYNEFTGGLDAWADAAPYNETSLKKFYGEGSGDDRVCKYNLQTVAQLSATDKSADSSLKADDSDTAVYFADTHYGDWPAPETFVLNTADS